MRNPEQDYYEARKVITLRPEYKEVKENAKFDYDFEKENLKSEFYNLGATSDFVRIPYDGLGPGEYYIPISFLQLDLKTVDQLFAHGEGNKKAVDAGNHDVIDQLIDRELDLVKDDLGDQRASHERKMKDRLQRMSGDYKEAAHTLKLIREESSEIDKEEAAIKDMLEMMNQSKHKI